MPILTKPTNAPAVSLKYITVGAVLTVLSGTSYYFLVRSSEHPVFEYFRMCALILGLVLIGIGFAVGRIGQVSGESRPVAVKAVVEAPVVTPVEPVSPVRSSTPASNFEAAVLTTANSTPID